RLVLRSDEEDVGGDSRQHLGLERLNVLGDRRRVRDFDFDLRVRLREGVENGGHLFLAGPGEERDRRLAIRAVVRRTAAGERERYRGQQGRCGEQGALVHEYSFVSWCFSRRRRPVAPTCYIDKLPRVSSTL